MAPLITFVQKGNFANTYNFLNRASFRNHMDVFHRYGEEGVRALSSYTPKRTGKTASSWNYKVVQKNGSTSIEWDNTNVIKGVKIAVILQYGHGTRHGGYVGGIDYINPALRPVFEKMANEIWNEIVGFFS